jgi:error-prone DNA polymerase
VINLVVPPKVYERHRLVVRSEPLLFAEGKLESYTQGGGAVNVLVDKLTAISAPGAIFAAIQDFSPRDDEILAENAQQSADLLDAGDFRAVAPPVMSFASGRRR